MLRKRVIAIAGAVVAAALLAVAAITATTGTDEARATLPPDLEKTITSQVKKTAIQVDPQDAEEVILEDGSKVYLVSGEHGDSCIGLADGSAACGKTANVDAGRLLLVTVPASGPPGEAAVPDEGGQVTVYGYQPALGTARATIVGAEGQALGSGAVTDGVYKVTVATDADARRIAEVRFDAEAGSEQEPPAAKLDVETGPE